MFRRFRRGGLCVSSRQNGAASIRQAVPAPCTRPCSGTVLIEGYTDSVGSDDYNQALSSRRAESVQSYLVGQGIDRGRLTASGLGESAPVADNESAMGRQLNRRVEVIISNPDLASR